MIIFCDVLRGRIVFICIGGHVLHRSAAEEHAGSNRTLQEAGTADAMLLFDFFVHLCGQSLLVYILGNLDEACLCLKNVVPLFPLFSRIDLCTAVNFNTIFFVHNILLKLSGTGFVPMLWPSFFVNVDLQR